MSVWTDIADFLFPRRCVMCGNRLVADESHLCTACFMHLPFTRYHTVEQNRLEKKFWAQFPIEKAAAMFYHDGEQVRHIIHHIKYQGHPTLGTYLAALYAKELQEVNFFDGIDAIVSLPLHWRRHLSRHYNQSHYIAEGISQVTGLPVMKRVVKRVRNNPSQTHLNSHQRMENVKNIFRLQHPESIAGKHLLLVDDVTTTGATLTSCAQELAKAPNVRISILTLSVAAQASNIPASDNEEIDVSVFGVPLME